MMKPVVDVQYVQYLLSVNDYAVERAILAIFNRQTEDEQNVGMTKHTNGRGFNGTDAHLGSYYAKWLMSNRRLSGRHLMKARLMMMKYAKQLVEVAQEKAKKQQENPVQENAGQDNV